MQRLPRPTDTPAGLRAVAVLLHLDEVSVARREMREDDLAELRLVLEHRGAA